MCSCLPVSTAAGPTQTSSLVTLSLASSAWAWHLFFHHTAPSPPQPPVGQLSHPLVPLSPTDVHYFMSCTVTAPFSHSTTVSPSSPHPICPSFSYPLFFLSVSHPFVLLGGSSMRGLPGLEVYSPWSIIVAPCSLKFTLQSIWNTWPNWSYSDWALLLMYSTQCYFASSLLMPQFGPYLFSLFIFCHILKPPFPQTLYSHHPDWTLS